MADQDTSLPIRTESAGDVDVHISDPSITTQKLAVNADGSIDVNATIPVGEKVIITDGTDDLGVNADGSLNVVATATNLDIRDLLFASDSVDVSGSAVTVSATDLDIRNLSASQDSVAISDGVEQLEINADGSINVKIDSDVSGAEVCDYQTSLAVAKNATVNHDYTVSVGTTFIGESAWISASGKCKVELLVNGLTKFVGFSSTANPNIEIPLHRILKGNTAEVIRMTIENRDNQAQDLYSTLLGVEV